MKISVLIPCRNEAKSIRECVESVLNQSRVPDEIIVVDDASTDKTLHILKKYTKKIKVVSLSTATGNKSFVQEYGMRYVTGDIVITTDADTVLDYEFIENILPAFKNKNIAAVAGYVKSTKHNWLTACRQIEYITGQELHKYAQSYIDALFVIPGCAAAYRTKIFKKYIGFDHDTLTEDLDFTYKLHKNNLKIAYSKDAIVYTQDPATLADYVHQLRRWYGGSWQNIIKHKSILNKPNNAFELSLVFAEGLIFPVLLILALTFNIKIFLFYYLSYTITIFLFTLYHALKDKRIDILFVTPIHLFVSFINYVVFIEQFVLEVFMNRNNLVWIQPKRRITA